MTRFPRFARLSAIGGLALLPAVWAGFRAAGVRGQDAGDGAELPAGAGRDCNRNGIPDDRDLARREIGFRGIAEHAVGGYPWSLAAADMDGDGDLDLVAANAPEGAISVHRNAGDGSFAPAVNIPGCWTPAGVLARDLDGDVRPDIVVLDMDCGEVSALLQVGDGNLQDGELEFAPAATLVDRIAPQSMLDGDFDLDGRADLVVLAPFEVALLVNLGGGAFRREKVSAIHSMVAIAAGDLDGDDLLDLVLAGRYREFDSWDIPDDVRLLRNLGGRFEETAAFGLRFTPRSATVLDLERDGDNDILVVNAEGLFLLENTGGGVFRPPSRLFEWELRPAALLVPSDLDGDGYPDLAAAVGDFVQTFLNRGEDGFLPAGGFGTGVAPASLLAADLDADGDDDLAAANAGSGSLTIRMNQGSASFLDVQRMRTPYPVAGMAAGDFDGDGRLDLAMAHGSGRESSVYRGLGNGRFSRLGRPGAGGSLIAAGDFDGDGALDLVVSGWRSPPQLLLNRGRWDFSVIEIPGPGDGAGAAAPADVDGDGALDLAMADAYANGLSIRFNLGGGTFGSPWTHAPRDGVLSLAAGDVDADGDVDLVYAERWSLAVKCLRNFGDGSFQEPLTVAGGLSGAGVALADFDGDGGLDIGYTWCGRGRAGGLGMLLNRGDGTWEEPVSVIVGQCPFRPIAVDLDGDGDLDLAAADPGANGVVLGLNRGDGGLEESAAFLVGEAPAGVVGGDFDADGDLDLIAGSSRYWDASLLFNTGVWGTSRDRNRNLVPDECESFRRGDCNGDGLLGGNAADAVVVLNFGFLGGPEPPCLAACDADGDGRVAGALTDAIYLLTFQFLQGPAPPAPFPACGPGAAADAVLGCETAPAYCSGESP